MVTLAEPSGQSSGSNQESGKNQEQSGPSPWFDLTAQGLMALFALGQVILTGLGIYYIRKTLASTDAAVGEAKKATLAAQEAVAVTRDSAERQLRAYVQAFAFQLFALVPGERPRGLVVLKNLGATPAYDLQCWIGIYVAPTDSAFDSFPRMKCEGLAGFVLAPTAPHILNITCDAEIDTATLNHVRSGHWSVFVYGETTYMDAFKHKRHTRFCTQHNGASALENGVESLKPAPFGNDAT